MLLSTPRLSQLFYEMKEQLKYIKEITLNNYNKTSVMDIVYKSLTQQKKKTT